MSIKTLSIVILAAGNGTRMRSEVPKVMHKLAGQYLIEYSLQLVLELLQEQITNIRIEDIVVVVNKYLATNNDFIDLINQYQDSNNENYIHNLRITIQEKQLGTGDAVLCGMKGAKDFVLILYGDTPLVECDDILKMLYKIDCDNSVTSKLTNGPFSKLSAVISGFYTHDSQGYGRLIVNDDGFVKKIIESKHLGNKSFSKLLNDRKMQEDLENLSIHGDMNIEPTKNAASKAELCNKPNKERSDLCNGGLMLCNFSLLYNFLNNASSHNTNLNTKELYLTDFIEYANNNDGYCVYVEINEENILGVNDCTQLASLENIIQKKLRNKFLKSGVMMIAPETVFLSKDTIIESGVLIYPYVFVGPGVLLKSKATIFSFSHLEYTIIGNESKIGPFARIRADSYIMSKCSIGNFVEVKNSLIENNVKSQHLSYIGDATIGQYSNVGAGVVFCNFDGKRKHRSEIGQNAFIGSNTSLIAPVKVGDGALVGAGSVITDDVPKNNLAIGRSRQINKIRKNT